MVVEIVVKDAETYERYKQLAPSSIAVYGGRYLVRGGNTEIGLSDDTRAWDETN